MQLSAFLRAEIWHKPCLGASRLRLAGKDYQRAVIHFRFLLSDFLQGPLYGSANMIAPTHFSTDPDSISDHFPVFGIRNLSYPALDLCKI
jgi:hypothetical protein